MIAKITLLPILATFLFLHQNTALGSATFKVAFQKTGAWSTDHWMEYKGKMPRLKEITSCHWEKINYFAADFNAITSYCIQILIKIKFCNLDL